MAFDEHNQCALLSCPPAQPPVQLDEGWEIRSVAALDWAAVAHAAIGIIWKAAVARSLGARKPVLGPKYEEILRLYLLKKTMLPTNCGLFVGVLEDAPRLDDPWHRVVTMPVTERSSDAKYHRHLFLLCGLYFEFYIGSALPSDLTSSCFVRHPQHPVVLMPSLECGLLNDHIDAMIDSSPSRKLASYWGLESSS